MSQTVLERQRQWRAAYRERHRERIRASASQWMRDHPEVGRRAYAKKHADPEAYNEASRERYAQNPLPRYERHLLKTYGLTLAEYMVFWNAQDGRCAICRGLEKSRNPRGDLKALAVDHDHVTGAIRGLLCHACNVALGGFGDNSERLRAAAAYLER